MFNWVPEYKKTKTKNGIPNIEIEVDISNLEGPPSVLLSYSN